MLGLAVHKNLQSKQGCVLRLAVNLPRLASVSQSFITCFHKHNRQVNIIKGNLSLKVMVSKALNFHNVWANKKTAIKQDWLSIYDFSSVTSRVTALIKTLVISPCSGSIDTRYYAPVKLPKRNIS